MNVLVTGSAGFLGRHACAMFEAQGHQVTGVDIRTGTDCRYVYDSAQRYDTVAHFAAIVGGRATIDGDPLAVAQTMALDVAFFRYIQRTRPRHSVYPSSSAAYQSHSRPAPITADCTSRTSTSTHQNCPTPCTDG